MSKVSVYLDNVFAALPNTPETRQMRQEIGARSEAQYEAAIQQGSSENEALGLVVSSFGSIEKLRAELGTQEQQAETQLDVQKQEQQAFAMQWVSDYMGFKQKYNRNMTIGIGTCVLSLVASSLLDEFLFLSFLSGPVFMLIGAVGVGILAYNGMQHSKYTNMLKIFGIDAEGGWAEPTPQLEETPQKSIGLQSETC